MSQRKSQELRVMYMMFLVGGSKSRPSADTADFRAVVSAMKGRCPQLKHMIPVEEDVLFCPRSARVGCDATSLHGSGGDFVRMTSGTHDSMCQAHGRTVVEAFNQELPDEARGSCSFSGERFGCRRKCLYIYICREATRVQPHIT